MNIKIIATFLLIISIKGYCQSDLEKKADINIQRIEALEERLNKLSILEKQATDSSSLIVKIDAILEHQQELLTKIAQLEICCSNRKVITESKDLNSLTIKSDHLGGLPEKGLPPVGIEEGKYYVVIVSRRSEAYAMKDLNKILLGHFGAILVQNKKDTWSHIIINNKYSIEEAIEKTKQIRKIGYVDAWWVNGSQLSE